MTNPCSQPALRILVVDDNSAIHDDFRKILLLPEERTKKLDALEAELFGGEPASLAEPISTPAAFEISAAYQGEQAVELVKAANAEGRPFSLAFVDMRMPPGISGIETIPRLWQVDPRLQIVICTAYSDHNWHDIVRTLGYRSSLLVIRKPFDSIEVLQAAHALTRKWLLALEAEQRFEDLELAVQNRTLALERTNRELSEQIELRAHAERELRKLATHDPLTGIPNRGLLRERTLAALARAQRHSSLVALMLIDLDHFKDVNDSYGHPAGDQLLQAFCERLRSCIRVTDTVARMGGDEFCILLEDISEAEEAAIIAERVTKACEAPFEVAGSLVHVSTSIGIAIFPTDCNDGEGLVKSADVAMYEAKESGRATYRYYSHAMLESSREKLVLREQLLRALEAEEFRVHYQPLYDARSGQICAMEALVRWQHPELGLVPPIKFIPAAEKSGLIVPIGAWVLKVACRQAAAWRRQGNTGLCVAVNASVREIQAPGFLELVTTALSEAELDPRALEIELTESAAMRDPELSADVLNRLHQMGVRLAIDDFGAGYSSLMRLREMPISVLKIDRFFVRDIVSSARDRAIVGAVVAMAHSLGLTVVAEGVETEAQLDALKDLRCDTTSTECDRIQGYLLSKPVPAEAASALLDAGQGPASLRRAG